VHEMQKAGAKFLARGVQRGEVNKIGSGGSGANRKSSWDKREGPSRHLVAKKGGDQQPRFREKKVLGGPGFLGEVGRANCRSLKADTGNQETNGNTRHKWGKNKTFVGQKKYSGGGEGQKNETGKHRASLTKRGQKKQQAQQERTRRRQWNRVQTARQEEASWS